MTDPGSPLRPRLNRLAVTTGSTPSSLATTVVLALLLTLFTLPVFSGCAKSSGNTGIGGSDTTSTQATGGTGGTGGVDGGTGGVGTGGKGGGTTTGTGGDKDGGTGTGTSSTSASGTGGASTSSSTSGTGGTGGTPFVPPVGTADYPAEQEPNDIPAMANALQAGTKGFTASIYPFGDIDVFSFAVTGPGTIVTVATSDGMGGCPAGAHTYVRIFDAAGNVYANSSGSTGCASFNVNNTPALLGLAVGTYYVHVESATLSPIPFYVVDIHVQSPSCGDGIVQVSSAEQCDHGSTNGVGSDGCSATCQIIGSNYLNETEPNNTQSTGNNLDGHTGAVGQINPVSDADWYTVDVTVAGSSIAAEIGDGFGNCPAFSSTLALYSPAGAQLVTDSGGGVTPCSKIAPVKYTAATNLPVGKYALAVTSAVSQLQLYYVLKVTVTPAGCGDGLLQAGEQCDPGPVSVPACSATCQFTADYIPETEPNGTTAQANPLGTHAGFIGSIKPIMDVDYFSFQVPGPASNVFLQVSDGLGGCPYGLDSVLRFYDPAGTQLMLDDNGGVGLCSQISPYDYPTQTMNLAAGTYFARVEFKNNTSTAQQYVLTVQVAQPACGDGIVEPGEQCDKGSANGTGTAGCTNTCQSLAPWEIEPNNTIAQATPAWPGFSTWKGSIIPVGDHDYYPIVLTAAGKVTLVTHDLDLPSTCTSDTKIFLVDSTGTVLTEDDDGGPGPGESGAGRCSKITAWPLAAGNYWVWVEHYNDGKIIPGYQLDLTVM